MGERQRGGRRGGGIRAIGRGTGTRPTAIRPPLDKSFKMIPVDTGHVIDWQVVCWGHCGLGLKDTHSVTRAAAWSAAGALADGNGRRAGRSRACRAPSRAIRRLPRCAAPSTSNWYTHGTRPCLDAAPPPAPVAAQVAGTRAAGSKTLAPTVEESPGYSEPGQGRHRRNGREV